MKPDIESADCRPAIKTSLCELCKNPFKLDIKKGWRATKAVVEEIKTNNFRGDDEVNFYHIECYYKKNKSQ